MRRRLRAVTAGLMVVVAGAAAGTAAADGTGPVASPPSAPQTQTVSGVAANGVQLSVTAPSQLPLDLPGQQLPEREADVTVKDVGGQGYTGSVTLTLTPEGSGASVGSLRLDHYDPGSGAWQSEDIPSGQASFTVTDTVTVPASGSQVVKVRLSPGTTVVDDVKLSVAANGASAVATMPVTGPAFQASGLTAAARAGSPAVLSGKLTNPTDVDLQHVSVKLLLCPAGSSGCVAHASAVLVEVQSAGGGAWHTVAVADGSGAGPLSATVVPDADVPPGGALNVSVRVTVAAGAFGQPAGQTPSQTSNQTPGQTPPAAQPMAVPLALSPVGLTLSGQPTVSGTLTVQPPPQQQPSSTPSSTPSASPTSSTPTPTASATPTATDSDSVSATEAPTGSPTPGSEPSDVAASTPTSASSTNPTVLVAAGLLAVCLALVLWWVLMKRRERLAQGPGGVPDVPDAPDPHDPHDAP